MNITKKIIENIALRAHETFVPDWLHVDENLNEPYYRFLFLLARVMSTDSAVPLTFVELGTWRGVSSMCLAEGAPNTRIVSFDIQTELRESARRPNVSYIHKSSVQADPDLKPVDLLFIDTEHNGALPFQEFRVWEPYLAPNAVVLFDDIFIDDGMKSFWNNFWPSGEKFDLNVHATGFGCVLMRPEEKA